MTVIKTLVKESNAAGNRLEAVIVKPEGQPYAIKYYVNNLYKHTEVFKEESLDIVENVAENWLKEVKSLNG